MNLQKKFPLWKNDGKPASLFSDRNLDSVSLLIKAIENNELRLVENKCLCNNEHSEQDVVVSEKDRYGLPIPQVLCSKCGLIRSGLVFDEESNNKFYEKYYRGVYSSNLPDNSFFQNQVKKGEKAFDLLKNIIDINKISIVAEIGCGAGGVLLPFMEAGMYITGYDYDENYLCFGRSKGLDLKYGDFYEQVECGSCDLVIMNHVFEHLLFPIDEMNRLLPKIKNNGYLYVEVPGIFCISTYYHEPFTYFQNAHVFNFYEQYLRVMFEQFNLKVIYGDERCTFICQKVSEVIPKVKYVYDESLSLYPQKNAEYLLECEKRYKEGLKLDKKNRFKGKLYNVACRLGWKKLRPYIRRNS